MTLLTEHLPLISGAPDGIKKLRELILELAVRGKLVSQDPDDEPARDLLQRIAEEKARLTEGKIKKAEAVGSESAEVSYPIPSTWVAAHLGQVVEIVRGITFPASEKSKLPESGRVACLRTSNVQNEIEWDDLLYIRESFVSRPDQYVQPHDIVMSMANSRELVGKVALIGATLDQATTFGGFLGVLRPVLIKPEFVMALLRTPQARGALIDSSSQTTNIANVSLAKLRPLPFAIPPFAEQHRIVAKVDELMALCDTLEAQQANAESAHDQLVQALLDSLTQASDADDFAASWQRLSEHFDTLFTTEPSIDALKQTVLQLAVMGKLVAQDPSDEPASELLKRIASKKAGCRIDAKAKSSIAQDEAFDNESYLSLEAGWTLVRLDAIARVGTGATPLRSNKLYFHPATYAWVTSGETARPFIEKTELRVSPKALAETNLTVYPPHTLVVAMYGQGKTRGQISELLIDACTNQACAAIQLIEEDSSHRKYVKYFFVKIYDEIRLLAAGGAQPNLNLGKIKETLIPLPPLAEQQRIVTKVDGLMSLCDQLKSRIRRAQDLNQQLASTLVERAVA